MRVSTVDKLFFIKHFATLIKAGVPISEVMTTIIEQSPNGLKNILIKVEGDIINGQSLANSLKKFPKVFDNFFVSLVNAGEESGNLEKNLGFLADQMTKDYALKQKVQSAMLYPSLILGSTMVMGTGIAWFILPKLIDLFSSFEVDLPLTTKVLMGLAVFMKNYGLIVVLGMISMIVIMITLLQIRPIKKFWQTIMLDFPLFGRVAINGELARFSRNLGMLLKSGLPTLTAIDITTNTLTNLKFVDDLQEIRNNVKGGMQIAKSMNRPKYFEFDKLTIRMIDVGERSGNLEEMLGYLSEYYDAEIDTASKNMSTLLEPILLLIIGTVVGFVALAVISPIYSLIGGIR